MPRWCACWEPMARQGVSCELCQWITSEDYLRSWHHVYSPTGRSGNHWSKLACCQATQRKPLEPSLRHLGPSPHINHLTIIWTWANYLTSLSLRFSFFEKGNNTSIQFLGPLWSLVITYIVLITAPGKQYIPNKSWLYLLYYCWCCFDDDDDGDDNMTMHIVSIP